MARVSRSKQCLDRTNRWLLAIPLLRVPPLPMRGGTRALAGRGPGVRLPLFLFRARTKERALAPERESHGGACRVCYDGGVPSAQEEDRMTGRMIEFESNGATAPCYLATPDGAQGATGPGVVVLHAWWGLTEPFRQACDQLA